MPRRCWDTVVITDEAVVGANVEFTSLTVTFNSETGFFIFDGTIASNPGEITGHIEFEFSYIETSVVEDSETVNVMSYQDGLQSSLNSQAFGNTNGFTKSEVNFSTFAFTISTYLVNGQLGKDMLALRGFRYRPGGQYSIETSKFGANDYVKIKLEFTNGYTNMPGVGEEASDDDPVKGEDFYCKYKVFSSQIGQEIAGIPNLTIAFTR